jgi:hypothetical protein
MVYLTSFDTTTIVKAVRDLDPNTYFLFGGTVVVGTYPDTWFMDNRCLPPIESCKRSFSLAGRRENQAKGNRIEYKILNKQTGERFWVSIMNLTKYYGSFAIECINAYDHCLRATDGYPREIEKTLPPPEGKELNDGEVLVKWKG